MAGGDQCGGSNQARCVMWTYKQCKTMLTHVFKPRWLVLILLSAGNREFRRGWEKAKFGEKEVERRDGGERERKRERKEDRTRMCGTERGRRQKDSRGWSARTKEGIAEIAELDRLPDDL